MNVLILLFRVCMRSSWKPEYCLLSKIRRRAFWTYDKALVFQNWHIGRTFHAYNGKQFFKCLVKRSMVGHRLGEFIMTKKTVIPHRRKRKKKQQAAKKKKATSKKNTKKKKKK